jgi:hypothetical protein
MKKLAYILPIAALQLFSCKKNTSLTEGSQAVYQDVAYLQDYAVKYYSEDENPEFKKVYTDRNEVIQVLTSDGLMNPNNGHFQYPGTLLKDQRYKAMDRKKVTDLTLHHDQFVYLDAEAIFSNAWAGKLFSRHQTPQAELVVGGKEFSFLIASGKAYSLVQDSKAVLTGGFSDFGWKV